MTKKKLIVLLSVVLILGAAIGVTLAWLTDQTTPIKNTFTFGNINITLSETEGGENREFKMVPGHTIDKDPTVTVKGGSEFCWLFVKLEKSTNLDTFLTYEPDADWTVGDGATGGIPINVLYREVGVSANDQSFNVLLNNKVTVKNTVTKADLVTLTPDTYPTLTFTAYAIQGFKDNLTKFSAVEAWTEVTK